MAQWLRIPNDMRQKLLVVEDDPISRKNISHYLSEDGFEVEQIPDGIKALERFEEEGFDLILTDVVMPGMDGLNLTERVHSVSPATPVIIMTGNGEIDFNKARAVGAADFIRKPIVLEEVLAKIKNLLVPRR
ncbi:MAG: response regulator [Candidatus Binatia bacterium]